MESNVKNISRQHVSILEVNHAHAVVNLQNFQYFNLYFL